MEETCEKLSSNVLTAEELLRSKGFRSCVLDDWERSQKILPTNGKKHFEPNNTWLQNVQIEKGLKNHRDLLNIERVERISELASAEWIPIQKKALVTKRSGQDWNNFGLEKNGSLYLLPEEALFLIETNCLELIWNGVPCSVQQAYEILIDDSVCTLEEYRVYSQLTRYGYHIQRYFSEEPKCNRSDEGTATKRKIIVDPNNGLRMCDSQLQSQDTEKLEETVSKDKSQISNRSFDHFKTKNDKTIGESIEQVVHNVLDKLLCIIEDDVDLNNPIASVVMQNNAMQSNMSSEEKNRNSKPEIISDETLLDNIKIFKGTCNSNKKPCKVSKWSGARIQRNVKQLPKRTDKISTEISIIDSDVANESSRSPDKRNQVGELSSMKKHEVIELSDDEIQELPHSMTRKEILNMLPNIAFQNCIVEKISRRYIPHTIRPQKSAYFYNRMQISRIQEDDKRARQNCKNIRTDTRQNSSQFENSADVHDRSIAFQNQQSRSLLGSPSRLFYPGQDQMHNMNIGLPYTYRFPFNYNQNIYMQNRIMQNTFHNLSIFLGNLRNAFQQSRNFTIMMNNFTMPVMEGYRMRHFSVDNQFRHSFQQNILWQHRFFETRSTIQNTSIQSSAHLNYPRQRQDYANSKDRVSHETVNRCSFTTYPGANSWTELKRRWSEEKTIIIDDEDNKNKNESEEECNEVQVVKLINPLIGPRNASSLMESFNKLAIIKSAPERTVRRKKSRYKISYNVYSCTHHYRKANPGQPLYSLVVIRKGNSFLEPVELNRLQQDAKGSQIILAYVSMSIRYIQPGIVTIPNMTLHNTFSTDQEII